MRTLQIKELDSQCYSIETKDFQDSDSVVYFWDRTSQSFYGEYQLATMEKRRFQRDTFVFKDYPTIGDAINFIIKKDYELMNERFKARIARPRVPDRIIV